MLIPRSTTGRLAMACAAACAAGMAWGVAETHMFRLRRVTVPALPAGAPPVKVLHVTDLHMQPGQRDKVAWVAGLAELEPDLVVNTGDNLGHMQGVTPVLEALAPLGDVPGVFVLGSNDYFAPRLPQPWKYILEQGSDKPRSHPRKRLPTGELVEGMERFGWVGLNNASSSMTVAGVPFDFVGVDDPHLGYDRYAEVGRRARGGETVTMGVMHAPYMRVVDAMTADRADVLLAGHTHGGQLCLPGGRALVTNCDIPPKYAKGLHRWETPVPEAIMSGAEGVEGYRQLGQLLPQHGREHVGLGFYDEEATGSVGAAPLEVPGNQTTRGAGRSAAAGMSRFGWHRAPGGGPGSGSSRCGRGAAEADSVGFGRCISDPGGGRLAGSGSGAGEVDSCSGVGDGVTGDGVEQAIAAGEVDATTAQAWLHVSAGLGAAPMFPFRIMCPPEATLLTLVARA